MTSPVQDLDHIAISVADLEAEAANYAALFGTPPAFQGQQSGTEMAVFQTGNVAVHLLESEKPRGLEGICFTVDKLARLQRRLGQVGIAAHESISLGQPNAEEHTLAVVAEPATTRNIQLSFIEKSSQGGRAGGSPGGGLDHIVIASQNAESTAFLLGSQLGLDLRMDMSRRDWNARLMFFRCGDLIVEVFERLENDASDGAKAESTAAPPEDSFYGLTWRVDDADASHKRLQESGFDVSEVRQGRKPGSRVLTVRNRTAGVATLLIELPKA
ncbi:VOC family protein [Congregibacter litoralis]|uniref:Glyoxalase/Bleomycin resistance protein/Dioxygenase superfamily n=1 Tax=Congregibacter litoralis KT71 TaxID=314285 RepID=A4ABJ3_9GAMM|nr:VOC family protein [Congregibacter litoralis]EAQ96747.1 Glyoxalase/Bleomycin resistance protein/Dioxygenase superfamily [Congregibacter litoralis KT71]